MPLFLPSGSGDFPQNFYRPGEQQYSGGSNSGNSKYQQFNYGDFRDYSKHVSNTINAAFTNIEQHINKINVSMKTTINGLDATAEATKKAAAHTDKWVTGIIKLTAATYAFRKAFDFANSIKNSITQIGFLENKTRALAGAFRNLRLENNRQQGLFASFAEQGGVSKRFSTGTEIQGLMNLRQSLQAQLGEGEGTKLALDITNAFGASTKELSKFLAMAGQGQVKEALSEFESVNIDKMSYALQALNLKQSQLGQTAFTLEKAYNDVSDSWEKFVRDVVDKNGLKLQDIFQQAAKAAISLYNTGAEIVNAYTPVLTLFEKIAYTIAWAASEWDEIFTGRMSDQANVVESHNSRAAQAMREGNIPLAREEMKLAQRAYINANRGASITPLSFTPATSPSLENVSKQQSEIQKALTAPELRALKLEGMQSELELEQKKVELLQQQYNLYRDTPSFYGKEWETLQALTKEYDTYIEQLKQKASILEQDKTNSGQQKFLEVMTAITNEQNKQLELSKALRAGYLSAIEASAVGAGRFEKILFTQENNLGLALDMRMAKANAALGRVGVPSGVNPLRLTGDYGADQANMNRYQSDLSRFYGKDGVMVKPVISSQTRTSINVAKSIGGNGSEELMKAAELLKQGTEKMSRNIEQNINGSEPPIRRGSPSHS